MNNQSTSCNHPEIDLIRDPKTIRARCHELLQLGISGKLKHFKVHEDRIKAVADFVIQVTKGNYPDGKVPYHSRWSHFAVGGVDRVGWLNQQVLCGRQDALARARAHYDLVVPSILLDAGAGMKWSYVDSLSGQHFSKSEGLAVASFDMFASGLFSSDPKCPFQTDADGLERLQIDVLSNGFQVTGSNPLVALEGRLQLMRNLGKALRNETYFGGPSAGRVGALVDFLIQEFGAEKINALDIFATVLAAFGSIWPGRLELHDTNLGDVWKHNMVSGAGATAKLIPFHKLSQWLTYSLLEPLEWCGIKIEGVDKLTGLAEYRNGGLFIDMQVIEPIKADALKHEWAPGDEFIVEWRALTVALLDVVADEVRRALGKTSEELPLAKVLQGGTWAAGRQVAAKLRPDGGSPVKLKSDGTVF